ncbi:MAG: nuclear transport factor 2 family protein [Rhodospirillales bacterium]|nr:nuclear transport factor 2 family protein [Rhodospirillales bacterium]
MALPRKRTHTHAEIDALFAQLSRAHADKDADAIADAYAPGAVIFDLAPPLGRRGTKREEIAAWLATWDGPVEVDARDVELTAEGDLAFSTAFNRMRGRQGGKEVDLWFRATMCLRWIGGRWRIVHEHTSVPFYMDGSYRAAIDLQP